MLIIRPLTVSSTLNLKQRQHLSVRSDVCILTSSQTDSNVQSDIISYNVATIAIVATTILVRTSVRAFIVKHVAIEDYLMLAAGGSAIALCAMVLVGTYLAHL